MGPVVSWQWRTDIQPRPSRHLEHDRLRRELGGWRDQDQMGLPTEGARLPPQRPRRTIRRAGRIVASQPQGADCRSAVRDSRSSGHREIARGEPFGEPVVDRASSARASSRAPCPTVVLRAWSTPSAPRPGLPLVCPVIAWRRGPRPPTAAAPHQHPAPRRNTWLMRPFLPARPVDLLETFIDHGQGRIQIALQGQASARADFRYGTRLCPPRLPVLETSTQEAMASAICPLRSLASPSTCAWHHT